MNSKLLANPLGENTVRFKIVALNQTVVQPESQQEWWESQNKTEKKRLWRQRDALTSKQEWKDHTWKNILRTLWWVWAVAWVWSLLWRIFWGRRKNAKVDTESESSWKTRREIRRERREKRREARRQRPFWQRPIWKIIKWWGIWLWVYWLWKRLGRWWKEWPTWRDSDKDKFNWYEEEIVNKPENKEKYQNYEALWDKVDKVYEQLYSRELKSWYQDELVMEKIAKEQSKWQKHYKWIIPYCLDNQFKTVEGVMSQNSSLKEAIAGGLHWMVLFIKKAWTNFLKMFVESYLQNLPSWAPFKNKAWSLSDKFDEWTTKNQQSEQELKYFFRQSIRVESYLFQKRNQLVKKIVKDAAKSYWISEDDIWNDGAKFKKHVENSSEYQRFMGSRIHSVGTVLSQNNIFDDQIDDDTKKLVTEIDDERDTILWCKKWDKDIIETINDKKARNEQLDANDDTKLWEACTWTLNAMDDIMETVEESAWTIWGDFLRMGGADLRKYLEKSGLDKMFLSLKQILLEQSNLLKSGKLDNEKKIALAETINSILALKKEAKLWEFTVKQDQDEHWNIIYRIPWFLAWSVKNIYTWICKLWWKEWKEWLEYLSSWWLWTWATLMLASWVLYLINPATWKALFKISAKATIAPAYLTYKCINHIKPVRDFGKRINPARYRGEKWAENLLADLADWKVSLDRAWDIIERRSFGLFTWDAQEQAWKKAFWIAEGMKWKNAAFNTIIKEKNWISYLNDLKNSGIYDTLVSQRDVSTEVRQAVLKGRPIDELKSLSFDDIVKRMKWDAYLKWIKSDPDLYKAMIEKWNQSNDLRKAVSDWVGIDDLKKVLSADDFDNVLKGIITDADYLKTLKSDKNLYEALRKNLSSCDNLKQAIKNKKPIDELKSILSFDETIDKQVVKILAEPGDFAKITATNLKKLKDVPINESEIKGFLNFMEEGFEIKYLGDLKKLCEIREGKFWEKIKKCLKNWNFDELKRLIKWNKNAKVSKALENIDCTKLLNHIDDIAKFKKLWKLWRSFWDDAVECFLKVLSKIF